MCGICGIRRFGDIPIPQVMFDILLVENQRRGNHATGVAIQHQSGEIFVHKNDVPAWNMVSSQNYKDFMKEFLTEDAITVLGHCRWATQGSPAENNNNHPMWAGTTAVIHNGHIGNDDMLFRNLKLDRKAETDSDILRAILDKHGFTAKGINTLDKAYGSAAIAAISTDYPGKLFLARSGNPLEYGGTRNYLLFSSERDPIKRAYRPVIKKFGLLMRHQGVDLALGSMPNDTAWVLGAEPKAGKKGWQADWLEHHQALRIATHFQPRTYEPHGPFFGIKTRYYDVTKANVVCCKKCNKWMILSEIQQANIKKLQCTGCGTKIFG